MSFSHYERCPKCSDNGRDRRGDNLACYADGGSHCFSCGYHRFPRGQVSTVSRQKVPVNDSKVLPPDFTRQVPTIAWKWLLQYGLSWKYWQPFVGWSEAHSRLVFTVGDPIQFSIGRYIQQKETEEAPRKWWAYGNCHNRAHLIAPTAESLGKTVLVEDLISAHKVGQITECIPLFGVRAFDSVIRTIRHIGLPVLMWLDKDQEHLAPRRASSLSLITGLECTYVHTAQDPKSLSLEKIKEIVNEQ